MTRDPMLTPALDPNGEKLAGYLAERDVACPRCEYNLRGLKRRSCPECGVRLSYAELSTEGTVWLSRRRGLVLYASAASAQLAALATFAPVIYHEIRRDALGGLVLTIPLGFACAFLLLTCSAGYFLRWMHLRRRRAAIAAVLWGWVGLTLLASAWMTATAFLAI